MLRDRIDFTPSRVLECVATTVVAIVIAFLILIGMGVMARAQHNHSEGHPEYLDWKSEKTGNCCSNEDCGDINASEIREVPTGTEVFVHAQGTEPQWCPVKKEHYLIKGRSPDWNKPHMCVNKTSYFANPCDALLCFTGKGGF